MLDRARGRNGQGLRMKKLATVLVAVGALVALSGCVHDPYYGRSYYGGGFHASPYGSSGYGYYRYGRPYNDGRYDRPYRGRYYGRRY